MITTLRTSVTIVLPFISLQLEGKLKQFAVVYSLNHPVPPWRTRAIYAMRHWKSVSLRTYAFNGTFQPWKTIVRRYTPQYMEKHSTNTGKHQLCVSGVFTRKEAIIVILLMLLLVVLFRGNMHAKMSSTHAVNAESIHIALFQFVYSVSTSGFSVDFDVTRNTSVEMHRSKLWFKLW